jgi:hypothetical protein
VTMPATSAGMSVPASAPVSVATPAAAVAAVAEVVAVTSELQPYCCSPSVRPTATS